MRTHVQRKIESTKHPSKTATRYKKHTIKKSFSNEHITSVCVAI